MVMKRRKKLLEYVSKYDRRVEYLFLQLIQYFTGDVEFSGIKSKLYYYAIEPTPDILAAKFVSYFNTISQIIQTLTFKE
jgi:hypothetical protein